jgi:hypothetical protein
MLDRSQTRKSEASSPEGEIRKKLYSLRLIVIAILLRIRDTLAWSI